MTRYQFYILLVPIWLGVSYVATGWESNAAAVMSFYTCVLAGVFLWKDRR